MTELAEKLAALAMMSAAQLRAEWRRVHRASPPPMTADLMMRGIAYRLQEQALGGLDAASKRELARLAAATSTTALQVATEIRLRPGTRLVRSWNGTGYSVLVTEGGFLFEDQTYRSLSHIARAITGARWSGPRFFGLKARAGDA
jgi:hypothetical protein